MFLVKAIIRSFFVVKNLLSIFTSRVTNTNHYFALNSKWSGILPKKKAKNKMLKPAISFLSIFWRLVVLECLYGGDKRKIASKGPQECHNFLKCPSTLNFMARSFPCGCFYFKNFFHTTIFLEAPSKLKFIAIIRALNCWDKVNLNTHHWIWIVHRTVNIAV